MGREAGKSSYKHSLGLEGNQSQWSPGWVRATLRSSEAPGQLLSLVSEMSPPPSAGSGVKGPGRGPRHSHLLMARGHLAPLGAKCEVGTTRGGVGDPRGLSQGCHMNRK